MSGAQDSKRADKVKLTDMAQGGMPLPDQSPYDGQQIVVRYGWHWYQYIQGQLSRLLYSDAWLGESEARAEATRQAQHLIDLLGRPIALTEMQIRLTESCLLQFSWDGVTWENVQGWAENALTCFQGPPGQDGGDGDSWNGDPPGNMEEGSSPESDTPLIILETCDLDILYGFIKQLVNFLDWMAVDFYQIIEAATNVFERFQSFISLVPALGPYVDLFTKIQDEFMEGYQANMTEALRIEYACELFCIARQNNCSLTWQLVADYFGSKVNGSPLGTIASIALYVVTGSWFGDAICNITLFLLTSVLNHGASWSGIRLVDIQRILTTYWNDPDTDWITLCEECPGWRVTFDYEQSSCGFIVRNGRGVYQQGLGWAADPGDITGEQSLDIFLEHAEPFDIASARLVYDFTRGENNLPDDLARLRDFTTSFAGTNPPDGENLVLSFDGLRTMAIDTGVTLTPGYDVNTPPPNPRGSALAKSLVVTGYGTIPQEYIDNATLVEML